MHPEGLMEPPVLHGKHRHHDTTPERSPIKRDPCLSIAGACGSKQRKLDLLAIADRCSSGLRVGTKLSPCTYILTKI